MHCTHGFHVTCPIVGHKPAAYMPLSTAGASPPPLRPAAFPPCGNLFLQLCGSALPSSGATFFFKPVRICMAGMSDIVLSTGSIEFILRPSLRRAPYPPPSDPVSRHRTGIVSSSLDPGSMAERISSSLALCPTFDLASALSSGSNFGWSLFFCPVRRHAQRTAAARVTSRRDTRARSVKCLS
jgi:hypothetical protein